MVPVSMEASEHQLASRVVDKKLILWYYGNPATVQCTSNMLC